MKAFEIVHYYHDRPAGVEYREYPNLAACIDGERWDMADPRGSGEFIETESADGVEIRRGNETRVIRPAPKDKELWEIDY